MTHILRTVVRFLSPSPGRSSDSGIIAEIIMIVVTAALYVAGWAAGWY